METYKDAARGSASPHSSRIAKIGNVGIIEQKQEKIVLERI